MNIKFILYLVFELTTLMLLIMALIFVIMNPEYTILYCASIPFIYVIDLVVKAVEGEIKKRRAK